MKLRNVNRAPRGNRYCGPAVMSALTGMDTDEAARLLRKVSGKRAIFGVSGPHLCDALMYAGLKAEVHSFFHDSKKRPTLAGWLKLCKADRTAGRVFLICAGQHWQLVSGRKYVCGQVGEVCSIKDPRVKRRARVERVYEIHPNRQPKDGPLYPQADRGPAALAQMFTLGGAR